MGRIGIRHENKSRFEARSPLTPEAVRRLVTDHGLAVTLQASPVRAFSAADYKAAGANIVEDLADCPIILGVKEIPPEVMEPDRTYLFFSHTIKGQPENMPALKRLMDLRCTLIDYERIVDEKDQRLVFFGRFAGLAGMIDALWALGRRLRFEGIASPFESITPARFYNDLDHARREIGKLSEVIRDQGLPEAITPFVCGFAGYGQVSQGAQEIFDLLPVKGVEPAELADLPADPRTCYKVVFTPAEGKTLNSYFEKDTGLLLREEMVGATGVRATTDLSDWEETQGIQSARTVKVRGPASYTLRYTSVAYDVDDIPADAFELPAMLKAVAP